MFRILSTTALLTLLSWSVLPAFAQAPQASLLEQTMGSAKFRAAGLDQQSPQQLKVLEEWLLQNGAELVASQPASQASTATAAAAATTAKRGWFGLGKSDAPAANSDVPNTTVVSRIAGSFDGWRGSTTLELENGQKWRIADGTSLHVRKPLDRPVATVKPGLIGGWNIQVEGYNTSAKVVPAN